MHAQGVAQAMSFLDRVTARPEGRGHGLAEAHRPPDSVPDNSEDLRGHALVIPRFVATILQEINSRELIRGRSR
jgi:hypothetical protein